MSDKDNKIVNTEEQNRAVNPGDSQFQEDDPSLGNPETTASEPEPPVNPEPETEGGVPHRAEGDESEGFEKKKPLS